ncbi:UBX domain-containing protein 8-like isoform X2 [Saccoglossus kowalevskii]
MTMLIFLLGNHVEYLLQNFHSRRRKKVVIQQGLSEDELNTKKEASRQKLQGEHTVKATDFNDRILKPRREAKEKEKEEKFYRFAGPAWKGKGEALGNASEEKCTAGSHVAGTSRDAASVRVLPESVTNPTPPVDKEAKHAEDLRREAKRKEKEEQFYRFAGPAWKGKGQALGTITLPEEPAEGSPMVMTIALKTPTGRTHRRRFLYTDNIQILIDYMTKLGYHPTMYSISSTYPRHCLTSDLEKTFEDLGLTKDVALVIEEKEDIDE